MVAMEAAAPAPAPSSSKPSPLEIVEYARWIGMDPLRDSHLLWICEEALEAPLPAGWSEHFDEDDEAYYHCAHSGETTREHPLDAHYRQLYMSLKQRSMQQPEPAPAPQPPPRATAASGGPALAPASVPRPPRPATVSVVAAGAMAEPSASAAAAAVAEAARQIQAQRVEALAARAGGQSQPPARASAAAAVARKMPGVGDAEDQEIGEDEKYKVGRCIVTSRELGHGSNGSLVHRGYWDSHPCAVKCLRKAFWALAQKDLRAVLGLWEEGSWAGGSGSSGSSSSSSRDNLVQYFGVEEDREFVYLCMERCKRPLSQIIDSGGTKSWDPRMQKHVLEQTLGAAEFLHSKGIVHLLLKPSNVFVNERYEVRIADSGLGRSMLSNPAAGGWGSSISAAGGMQLGNTAGWRARELLLQDEQLAEARKADAEAAEAAAMLAAGAQGHQQQLQEAKKGELELKLTSAADVFSLGCLGYYLLTHGQHPFGSRLADRDGRVILGNSGYDIAALNATEPQGHDLIASMIQASPKGRPTAAAARRHPYFWEQPRRASFICSVSRLLSQGSTVAISARKRLNEAKGASTVVRDGGSWDILLDAPVLAYMTTAAEIEGRGYDRNSVHDLLRLVAFTLGQLEPEHAAAAAADAAASGWRRCISSAAAELIGQAGGTLQYFTSSARFPGLLMFTYWHVFKEASDAKGRHAEMWAPLYAELHGATAAASHD